jgi:hypothetical protein
MASDRITTRRGMIESLLGLGAASVVHAALDSTAWRAYESVEQTWIRDRHALLIRQSPQLEEVAQIDLDLKIAELQRRAIEFKHLMKRNPRQLRGGVWQLSWLPVSEQEKRQLESSHAGYKRQEGKVRELADSLRKHAEYQAFRNAQMQLWKTPEYKAIHRKFSESMLELHRTYGAASFGAP